MKVGTFEIKGIDGWKTLAEISGVTIDSSKVYIMQVKGSYSLCFSIGTEEPTDADCFVIKPFDLPFEYRPIEGDLYIKTELGVGSGILYIEEGGVQ